jgi:hypothetical protein
MFDLPGHKWVIGASTQLGSIKPPRVLVARQCDFLAEMSQEKFTIFGEEIAAKKKAQGPKSLGPWLTLGS